MRICFIDRSAWWAGAEECLAWLALGLKGRGHEVEVVVDFPMPHHSRYADRQIPITPRMKRAPIWGAERWRGAPRGLDRLGVVHRAKILRTYLENRQPDLVYINLLRTRARWDIMAAHKVGIPVVGHLRQLDHQSFPNGATLSLADHCIAVSEIVASQARHENGAASVTPIYDGIDPGRLAYTARSSDARASLGLPENGFILGFPAAFEPRKGQDTALDVLETLSQEFPDVYLVFAGSETKLPDSLQYYDKLRRRAGMPDLQNRVFFLGRCDDMAAFYAASDIVLALSQDGEAFGMVAAEAGLTGKPVVGTRAGATPEVVMDGETGILVPPGDISKTMEALRLLASNRAWAGEIGGEAAQFCREKFDPTKSLDRYEQVLFGVTGEKTVARVAPSLSRRVNGSAV